MNKKNKGLVPQLRFPEFEDTSEWKKGSIEEMISDGILMPPKDGNHGNIHPKSSDYVDSGIPFIMASDIQSGKIDLINCSKIRKSQAEKLQKGFAKEGDVLLTHKGTIGEISIIEKIIYPYLMLTPQVTYYRIRDKEKLYNKYLAYIFSSQQFQEKLVSASGGGTRAYIGITEQRKLTISLPPSIEEQQRIADCLSFLDDTIGGHTKKLEVLQLYKKGLMQNLFPAEGETTPKLRFPGFKNDGDWKKIKLIDTANKEIKWSFIGGPFGSNLKSSDYTDSGIRIIQLQNIGDGEFIDNYKIYTSEDKAEELLSCNIYPGDIILSKMGDPVARACLIPDVEHRYVMCSDGIRLAVNESKNDKYFIYSTINSDSFRKTAENSSTGSTRKRIGLDVLKQLTIMIPSISEQQNISKVLLTIDNNIANQSKKIESLKAHKKGLMQQLFPSQELLEA